MKKITNKKYEAIIQAKNIISQLCEDGAMDYVESGVDVVRNTCLMKAPALLKEALLTVLTSGTISVMVFRCLLQRAAAKISQ